MLRHVFSAVIGLAFATVAAGTTPGLATPVAGRLAVVQEDLLEQVQYSAEQSRGFRHCMRQKYGPRYFRGVKRAHRYHMVQACGG